MNPILQIALTAIFGLLSSAAILLVSRALNKSDAQGKRTDALEGRLHALELQIAKELATKDDVREVKRDVESVITTMHEIRDMVIRLEERHKSNG